MCSDTLRARARRRGFSLIEFTVVLALIGLLAGIVTIGVRPMLTRGKQNAARAEIASIRQALEQFYSVYGRYPTNDEALSVLCKPTDRIAEPLLTQSPTDPWGRAYQYNSPGRSEPYEVICFGADGREGGSGADADIVSWDLKESSVAKASR
jgi:general secretion pathway protein G